MRSFKKNFFSITLTTLVVLFVSASYFRFVVVQDYHVTYEVSCDPSQASCFVGCEDDECTTEYFYAIVDKYAHDIVAECGTSVADCELANSCQANNRYCTIEYCDSDAEGVSCSSSVNNDI